MQFYGLKMQENYKKLGGFTTSSCKKCKIQYKVVEKIGEKNFRKIFENFQKKFFLKKMVKFEGFFRNFDWIRI